MEVRIDVDMRMVDGMLQRAPAAIRRGIEEAATDVQTLLLNAMQVYPAQLAPIQGVTQITRFVTRSGRGVAFVAGPREPYRRTFTLRKSWQRRPRQWQGNVLIAEIYSAGNEAPYNIYVQKHDSQAAVHRGHWESEMQVVTRLTPTILRFSQESIAGAAVGLQR
ncbi:MAG: hypothetical protein ACOYD4_06925 [Solirubrobacterales bacterium]